MCKSSSSQMLIMSLVVAALVGTSAASSSYFGSCLSAPVISDFNIAKYLGTWYEVSRSNVFFERQLRCNTANYSQRNATSINGHNAAINIKTNLKESGDVIAVVTDPAAPNKLQLVKTAQSPNGGDYEVWTTDYTTYSVVYSCRQIVPHLLKFELIWILAREQTLDAGLLAQLKATLKAANVETSHFVVGDQTNCF